MILKQEKIGKGENLLVVLRKAFLKIFSNTELFSDAIEEHSRTTEKAL